MTIVEDTVGLSADYAILRKLNKQKDAHYEAAEKGVGFKVAWRENPDLLPREPPSSTRMKCVPAVESTGRLELDANGDLTFPDSTGMVAAQIVEVPDEV